MSSYGFHESTLIRVEEIKGGIVLFFDEVVVGTVKMPTRVVLREVRSILRDGRPIDRFHFEAEDSEVLTLNYTETSMQLIVIWSSYRLKRHDTRAYSFECAEVEILEGQGVS